MKRFVCILLAVSAYACHSVPEKTSAEKPKTFRMVEAPAMLDTPEERADYVARHYWQNFDFSDTSYIRLPEVTEQAFADYVAVLGQLSPDLAAVSVRTTLAGAEADTAMFAYFAELFDKYLYDPNSPVRNEEIYIPVLEYIRGFGQGERRGQDPPPVPSRHGAQEPSGNAGRRFHLHARVGGYGYALRREGRLSRSFHQQSGLYGLQRRPSSRSPPPNCSPV